MTRRGVYTESKSGGDRVFLGELGKIDGLQWSWTWPGGPEKATFRFSRNARFHHRGLTQGRTLAIPCGGGRVWRGNLAAPERGDPWTLEADGLGALASSYIADAPTSGNPFNLQEVVTQAIARGLPWNPVSGLPTGAGDQSTSGGDAERLSVAGVLSRVLPEFGETWYVDADGDLQVAGIPTQVSHNFLTADPAGGRTVHGYVSAYYVVFNHRTTGAVATVWVRNAEAEVSRPPVEEVLDLTGRGNMTQATAVMIARAKLALAGPRLPFADSFTFARGMVCNQYGTPVDLATVRPPILGRLLLTDPDHPAETSFAAFTDILIRRTTYYEDTDTLEVEPLDLRNSDLRSLLGNTSAPSDSADSARSGRRYYGPYLEMTHSAAQATTNGGTLVVAFNTDVANSYGPEFHDPAGVLQANTDVVIPVDGVYAIKEQVEFAANVTGQRQVNIFSSVDGNLAVENKNASGSGTTKVNAYVEHEMHAGDVLTFGARPDGAAPSVTTTTYSPRVTVRWLRPLP